MAKRTSATRTEARRRAEARQAAQLHRLQQLIEKSTDVFEVAGRVGDVGQREAAAKEKARAKFDRELETIRQRFDEERRELLRQRDAAVAVMLDIEGATVKEVAEAVELSQSEVKRIKKEHSGDRQAAAPAASVDRSGDEGSVSVVEREVSAPAAV